MASALTPRGGILGASTFAEGPGMRWWLAGLIGLAVVGGAAAWAALGLSARRAPIKVGLLHSRTGPMKISEESMIEAEILALEEVNKDGLLPGGRRPRGLAADPGRDGRRDLRLLDLGQPEERQAGRRAAPSPAVLSHGL